MLAPTAFADTVGTLAGFNQPPDTVQDQLQGQVCNDNSALSPNRCTSLVYENFNADMVAGVTSGVQTLDEFLSSTDHVTVFAYSEGAVVASQWLAAHPDASGDTFILIGSPARGDGGVIPIDISTTQEQVVDIGRQYEFWTDQPNNLSSPYYLLAVLNTLAGAVTLHDYTQVDPNDPSMVVWQDGNITYKLLPTGTLPLIAWTGDMAPALDDQLRPLIEDAYIRSVPIPDPTPPATTAVTQEVTTWSAAPAPSAGLASNVNTLEAVPSPETTRLRKTTSQATSAKTSVAPKVRESHKAEHKAEHKAAAAQHKAAAVERKTQRQTAKAERKAGKKDR